MNVPKRVHLIGIGGTGMSSIARVLMEMGKTVSGSDMADSHVLDTLRELGASIFIGHAAEHVEGAELVVTSTAIGKDNPEVNEALRRGIPIMHRSDVWAQILNSGRGVAVAGAHGKTTITSMIAWVAHNCGLNPTFLIGGEIAGLGGGRAGSSDIVVAEADESDGSFLRYRPWCTVLTRIEPDHLENYNGSFAELVDAYRRFLSLIKPTGLAVLCSDDPTVTDLGRDLKVRRITYGLQSEADYTARDIGLQGFRTFAQVFFRGKALGSLNLSVPGPHNLQNALAVVAVCRELGLGWEQIAEHLATFRGARRRFEVVADAGDVLIIDDYAHHPSEVRATLRAARLGWPDRRIVAVFQPHRYARTHFLLNEFAEAFCDANHVVLTEIYAPRSERPIPGISGQRVAEVVERGCGPQTTVDFVPERARIAAHLRQIVERGDIVVTMGPGDIWRTAREFAEMVGYPT